MVNAYFSGKWTDFSVYVLSISEVRRNTVVRSSSIFEVGGEISVKNTPRRYFRGKRIYFSGKFVKNFVVRGNKSGLNAPTKQR